METFQTVMDILGKLSVVFILVLAFVALSKRNKEDSFLGKSSVSSDEIEGARVQQFAHWQSLGKINLTHGLSIIDASQRTNMPLKFLLKVPFWGEREVEALLDNKESRLIALRVRLEEGEVKSYDEMNLAAVNGEMQINGGLELLDITSGKLAVCDSSDPDKAVLYDCVYGKHKVYYGYSDGKVVSVLVTFLNPYALAREK